MSEETSIARLIKELPENYEKECENKGAVSRWRGIKNASNLMFLILTHLMNGTSLLEITVVAKMLNIGDFSDVSFMKRLAKCKDWFIWISQQLLGRVVADYQKPVWLREYTVVAADASDVVEKGRAKRTFRLHYLLNIFNMSCEDFKITNQKTGEKLNNFTVKEKMLVVADRIYSTVNGMEHCLKNGADFILRMRKNSFKTVDKHGEIVDLLGKFEVLKDGEIADIKAFAKNQAGEVIPVRICAKRKTEEQIQKSWKKMKNVASSHNFEHSDEAKLLNKYIVVVTSLDDEFSAEQIMETYRLKWQIEICFKRFKSILDFGELPKKTDNSTMAWLCGKLMVALLLESVMANSFSPGGENEIFAVKEHIS